MTGNTYRYWFIDAGTKHNRKQMQNYRLFFGVQQECCGLCLAWKAHSYHSLLMEIGRCGHTGRHATALLTSDRCHSQWGCGLPLPIFSDMLSHGSLTYSAVSSFFGFCKLGRLWGSAQENAAFWRYKFQLITEDIPVAL